jgi:endonuclease I
MRYPLPKILRKQLRLYQPLDIYTHQFLTPNERTIEHVIPVKRIPNDKRIQLDPSHLFITHLEMNQFRSHFRFGGYDEEEPRNEKGWKEFNGSYQHRKKGVFYPRYSHRLLAHILWKMMDKYPPLRDFENQYFETTDCWNQWLQKPWTPVEKVILENNHRLLSK